MGGTMRLGAYPCAVQNGTLLENLYGASLISERHRHRYEFNNEYREELQEKGLCISGVRRRKTRGGGRTSRKALLRGRTVPSRIQIPPQRAAPALCGLYPRGSGKIREFFLQGEQECLTKRVPRGKMVQSWKEDY